MPLFSPGAILGAQASGYKVSNSLRFRSSASAYLNRTPGSAGNRKTWTFSAWVKRGSTSTPQYVFCTGAAAANFELFAFSGDNLYYYRQISSAGDAELRTNAVYRDFSAWYHVVLSVDAANATAAIYVNGVQQTLSLSDMPSNVNGPTNNTELQVIGRRSYDGASPFDGYLAEVNFIDGQALTPSSFGQSNATTGVWQPKAYTGTYGTNGFYLKFTDVGSTTAGGGNSGYGKDFSGNSNYWATNNLNSTSTSTSYDSMIDTPTPYDDGGNGVGNYCVLNPLASNAATLSNANLKESAAAACSVYGTMASSGKLYFEVTVSFTNPGYSYFGVALASSTPTASTSLATVPSSNWIWREDGNKANNGSGTAYGTALSTGQIGMVAYDPTTGNLWFGAQNAWFGSGNPATGANPSYTLTAGTVVVPVVGSQGASGASILEPNFGQRPFTYTPPSGFKALNTQNLPTPTIAAGGNYMAAVLYSGTSASNTVVATSSNSGNNPLALTFQPDLVWIKSRSAATNHELTDAVRGVTKSLVSNSTAAEATDTNGLTAFTSTGFTVGSDSNYNNGTGPATYVAWEWKGGNGTVSNTSGSITSTVSANTTAGFSVVTFTVANVSSPQTIGHGLGVAPSMYIVKPRSFAGGWYVYHTSIGATKFLQLQLTDAATTSANPWNNTSPTSTVLTIGSSYLPDPSNSTFVAYCFAAVAGYSAFGSYTGNGSADGPFVFTGFRPRWIMIKSSSAAESWYIIDTSRDTYNAALKILTPNASDAEFNNGSTWADITSNGFKIRYNAAPFNTSSGTYIYAAFAENPFKYSLAR